jgi:hypothetical protein
MLFQYYETRVLPPSQCMDSGDYDLEDDGADDAQEAEQDEALFEYAGEVIPALGRAMAPSAFAPISPDCYLICCARLRDNVPRYCSKL